MPAGGDESSGRPPASEDANQSRNQATSSAPNTIDKASSGLAAGRVPPPTGIAFFRLATSVPFQHAPCLLSLRRIMRRYNPLRVGLRVADLAFPRRADEKRQTIATPNSLA